MVLGHLNGSGKTSSGQHSNGAGVGSGSGSGSKALGGAQSGPSALKGVMSGLDASGAAASEEAATVKADPLTNKAKSDLVAAQGANMNAPVIPSDDTDAKPPPTAAEKQLAAVAAAGGGTEPRAEGFSVGVTSGKVGGDVAESKGAGDQPENLEDDVNKEPEIMVPEDASSAGHLMMSYQ
eukprot:GFYU01016301.1.p1 GENE.GFYU01016301.1~~GFYU01016301.1.p1  ORF type:complete len:189 (-),score=66.05 GFYU01016301.1:220-759(-)